MDRFKILFECDGISYSGDVERLYKTCNLPLEYHVYNLDPRLGLTYIWAIVYNENICNFTWVFIPDNDAPIKIMNAIVDYFLQTAKTV